MKGKRKLSRKARLAIRQAQKARWARVHATTDQVVGTSSAGQSFIASVDLRNRERRKLEKESDGVVTGRTARSSSQAPFYHDIPPELFRRLGNRHKGGHLKYSPKITMNLNYRQGIDDPFYIMDRLNHVFEHLVAFLADGDELDDNLAAAVWNISFLMEAEKIAPEAVKMVIGQSKLFGKSAEEFRKYLEASQCK